MKINPRSFSLNVFYEKVNHSFFYAKLRGWLDGNRNYPSSDIFAQLKDSDNSTFVVVSKYEKFIWNCCKRKILLINQNTNLKKNQLNAELAYLFSKMLQLNPVIYDAIYEQFRAGLPLISNNIFQDTPKIIEEASENATSETENEFSKKIKTDIETRANQTHTSDKNLTDARLLLGELKFEVEKHWKNAPSKTLFQKIAHWLVLILAGIIEAPLNYYAITGAGEFSSFALAVGLFICIFFPFVNHIAGKSLRKSIPLNSIWETIFNWLMTLVLIGCLIATIVILAFFREAVINSGSVQQILSNISNSFALFLILQIGLLSGVLYSSFLYFKGYDPDESAKLRKETSRYLRADKDYVILQNTQSKYFDLGRMLKERLSSVDDEAQKARGLAISRAVELITEYRDTNIKRRQTKDNEKDWIQKLPASWKMDHKDMRKSFINSLQQRDEDKLLQELGDLQTEQ